MDNPVTHRELEQFRDLMESENERLKEENDRQNHRIRVLEDSVREISNLAASTEKLAANMENMLKVQEQQGKRLEQIESRDGEKWRKAMAYIGTAILGAVLAIVFLPVLFPKNLLRLQYRISDPLFSYNQLFSTDPFL